MPDPVEPGRMTRALGRENWLAAAVLLTLIALVHYDVIFLGRSLLHTNLHNPIDYRPLPQNYGDRMVSRDRWAAHNLFPYANIRDPGATWWQWEPSRVFLRDAIEQREWPFWDPYVAAGTPAMANMIPAFFFPPYVLVVWLGASVALLNAYYLFLLWAASFVTFLLLRRHQLGVTASLSGAVFVLMSGALNQNLGSFMGQTASCLPLAFYATRVFLDRPTYRRAAGLALAYAATALASFPPLVLAIFGLTALYFLVAITVDGGPHARAVTARRWAAATLLSVGLVGFYYGPAFQLSRAVPQVVASYRGVGLEAMPLVNAFQLLSPTIFGGVQVYLDGPFTPVAGPHIPYVGMVVVFSILLAQSAATRHSRALFITSLIGAAVILLKLFGIPPVQWIGIASLLRSDPFRLLLRRPARVPLCIPGGVRRGERGAREHAGVATNRSFRAQRARFGKPEVAGGAGTPPAGGERLAERLAGAWNDRGLVRRGRLDDRRRTPPKNAGARRRLLSAGSRRGRGHLQQHLSQSSGLGYFPPSRTVYSRAPEGSRLVASFRRRSARTQTRMKPSASPRSIPSWRSIRPGCSSCTRRYASPPPGVFMREATSLPPEPVLDRMNVSFIGARNAFPWALTAARDRNYRLRFDDGYVSLFERATRPRFWFSSEFRVLSKEAALEAVGVAGTDEVILEAHPGFDAISSPLDDHPVTVEAYHRNSTTLVVDAPRQGLLYASESFFDGWTASVNGSPTPILPANYAFRAVVVPQGRSRVEFSYWPPGLTSGLWSSGVSALIVLGLAVVPQSLGARHDEHVVA